MHIVNDSDPDSHNTPKAPPGKNHVKGKEVNHSESRLQTEESSDVSSSESEGNSDILEMILVNDVAGGTEVST